MNSPVVLHVIPGLGGGGAEQMLANLVTAKRMQPITSVVANLLHDGSLTSAIREAGVPVHVVGFRQRIMLPATIFQLTALIRHLKPVAIQSWLYYADLLSLWALKLSGRRDKTRLFWSVRCSDMDLRQYGYGLRWSVHACVNRSSQPDAVVANSFSGRAYHEQIGYAPRAFPVIPNGIDTERFRPDPLARKQIRTQLGIAESKPTVLQVGRVDPMKDYASFAAMAASLPDVQFLIAGEGTKRLSIPQNVMALGARSDMPALFAAADLLVMTSAFGEGFPNVVAESMASGVPVAATDVGDARRIVGETGIVVAPRDVKAIAAAVRQLLAEPDAEKHRRAQVSRHRIEHYYSLDRAVAAFDALHLNGWSTELDEPKAAAKVTE